MSFSSEILSRSPKLYARLGESSGTTAIDSSGNGLNGTYHNVTLGATPIAALAGNTAADFNGTSSYVDFGNPTALRITSNITVLCLVELGSTMPPNSVWALICKGFDGTNEGYMLQLFSYVGTQVSFSQFDGTSHGTQIDNLSWSAGDQHLIVGSWDGTNWKLYIDGSLVAATAGPGPLSTTKSVLVGAADENGSITRYYDGIIDEVAIFDTALSLSDVQAIATAAGLLAASPTLNTATVNTTGAKIDLTFSASVTGVSASDFFVTADGIPVSLTTATGSAASWSLPLTAPGFIYTGQVVKVAYAGSAIAGVANVTLTATNSSARTANQVRLLKRGMEGFIHFSGATFAGLDNNTTQAMVNTAFNPASLDIDQWLDVLQSAGCTTAVLTAKHYAMALWPTASGCPNIGPTPWYTTNQIDIVQDFVTRCRARGMLVGLYLNFYDTYWLNVRSGHDGTYSGAYQAYITTQLTELLSNYGVIDELWVDSWTYNAGDVAQPGYTIADYATIRALITSLQPNCVLVNNVHLSDLSHSDIACYEGDGVQAVPSSTNVVPAQYCETIRADLGWTWTASGQNSYKDVYALANRFRALRAARSNWLLNFPPNDQGVMPASTATFAAALGAVVGAQGVPGLPLPNQVATGVDRGDGALGTSTGGGGGGAFAYVA